MLKKKVSNSLKQKSQTAGSGVCRMQAAYVSAYVIDVCASGCVCFCVEKQCKLTWVGPSCGGFPEHNLLVHGWNLHADTVLQASGSLPRPPPTPNSFCWGLVDIGRRGSH